MLEAVYCHAFNSIRDIGPGNLRLLYRHFNTMEAAWKASQEDLARSGITKIAIKKILAHRKKFRPEREFAHLTKTGIRTTTIGESTYPSLLRAIYDPPLILYWRGSIIGSIAGDNRENSPLAVVGSRKATAYGIRCVKKIVRELACAGIPVVSGLALGIDTAVHRICLECGGSTYAVLPCGIDSVYPATNRDLAKKIAANGGLTTEFPPTTVPAAHSFYQRNRLISGLCRGVIIIEAGVASGTRITARFALEQNREIFAVPGDIFSPYSAGPNTLIRNSEARLVVSAEDILAELPEYAAKNVSLESKELNEKRQTLALVNLTEEQRQIAPYLAGLGASIDKLVRLTKLETNVVLAIISEMELTGIIEKSGNRYHLSD